MRFDRELAEDGREMAISTKEKQELCHNVCAVLIGGEGSREELISVHH